MTSSNKPPSQRQLRVGEEIRHIMASIFQREDFPQEPDLKNLSLVTVTEVRITPDLKHATAYVMPLGGQNMDGVLKALVRIRPLLRHLVTRSISLKFAPNLHFRIDESFDEASRIEALLRNPHVARDIGKPSANEDE